MMRIKRLSFLFIAAIAQLTGCPDTSKHRDPSVHPPKEDMINFAGGPFLGRGRTCDEGKTTKRFPKDLDDWSIRRIPLHIAPFSIDRRVVSCDDIKRCIAAGECDGGQTRCYPINVAVVSLVFAIQYCKWRGAMLPSYLEWQRAGRGTKGDTDPLDEYHLPCKKTTPAIYDTPRCPITTSEGFEYAIRNLYSGEYTRDRDCFDGEQAALRVDLLSERLDLVAPADAKSSDYGEFRCADQHAK